VAPPTVRPLPRPDVTPPTNTNVTLLYAQGQKIGALPLNGSRLDATRSKTLLTLHVRPSRIDGQLHILANLNFDKFKADVIVAIKEWPMVYPDLVSYTVSAVIYCLSLTDLQFSAIEKLFARSISEQLLDLEISWLALIRTKMSDL